MKEIPNRISDAVDVVTVDVFDTLLLRRPIAERRRIFEICSQVHRHLAGLRMNRPLDFLHWSRRYTQSTAFRLRTNGASDPEVRLADIISLQCELLALPEDLGARLFGDAENDVEEKCLFLSESRCKRLTELSAIRPVIAISDTMLSRNLLTDLLDRKKCRIPFREVYTSADAGTTKRDGTLFQTVAQEKGFSLGKSIHIGDDANADIAKAEKSGVAQAIHLPRSKIHNVRRKLDGVAFVLAKSRLRPKPAPAAIDRSEFHGEIMGPIVADICLRLWVHLRHLDRCGNAKALYCARGGLVLGDLFERFLESSKLPLDLPRGRIMISRLVAARAALPHGGPSVFDELAREYRDQPLKEALRALAGCDFDIGAVGAAAVDGARLRSFMDSANGRRLVDAVADQNALFAEHVRVCAPDSERLVLIDTGLYGSTQRFMEDAFPERRFQSLLIARANYKHLPTPHFPRTIGLVTERDTYSRIQPTSVALRYWHLIEDFFEPELESVREFHRLETGAVVSNLEVPGWQEKILARPHLADVIDHIDQLDQEAIWSVPANAERAWRRLRRMITFPSMQDVEMLDTGRRSRDFGQEGSVSAISERKPGHLDSVRAVMNARWKEGSIAVHAGGFRQIAQLGLEAAYTIRSVRALLNR